MIALNEIAILQGAFQMNDISFTVDHQNYGILMGSTGSGKTTILEIVCGLRKPTFGEVILDEQDATRLRPGERPLGYVPQDGALFPTMTVARQIGFALKIRKQKPNVIQERVQELAKLLGIKHLLERKPQGLSGGERQRVALARALAHRPKVLCLDEPFSALDEDTRHRMYDLMRKVHEHEQFTALHITHSQQEAKALGDELFRLRDGKVVREQEEVKP